ncbi:helix-turn-helix transcriptional regulator [Actinacidiphila sp. DG2A-62]|uniref:helix-turn-helix domain-containing protein n=1 Tax=Actinacidiphila sp. DG2A-62 TaxID=3108821 RepID=UPI002DB6BE70|nr:helix-turn-helix transcriptional regulator [Actinacidiphila sp. DG2A-62]MEC3994040.1 helix-turn-helix transcriptional regulator [Actinacidiphila sp. DG2A-62]
MPPDPRPDWVLAQRREIGHRIARRRAALGWTVERLAGAAGVSRDSVLRAEHATRSTGLDVLLQLADALGVTVGRLLDEDPVATDAGVPQPPR